MDDPQPTIETGRYVCPVCGQAEPDLAAKKAHVRSEHPRAKKVRRG